MNRALFAAACLLLTSSALAQKPAAAATPATTGDAPKPDDGPLETTLAVGVRSGVNARFGTSTGLDGTELVGLGYGLGAWLSPTRLYSLGLAFEHSGIGSERTAPTDNSLRVERSIDSLWLGGRAYPLRSDHVGLFVGLRLGATWQHLQASGTRAGSGFGPQAAFACSASDGPGFALGGGVGVDVDIDRHFALITEVDASAHRLTSEPLDGCAPGAGSVTTIGAHLGFAYRFDLGGAL